MVNNFMATVCVTIVGCMATNAGHTMRSGLGEILETEHVLVVEPVIGTHHAVQIR